MNHSESLLLSHREQQAINALKQGRSAKEIAGDLGLTVNTVRAYLRTIYSKLNVHSALELLAALNSIGRTEDHGQKRLLEAMQLVLGAHGPNAVLPSLALALKRCTAATRVSFWTAHAASGASAIALPCGSQQGGPPSREFITELIEHGWAIHPSCLLSESLPNRSEKPGGVIRRAIGATLATPGEPRPFVLVTDPATGSFSGADVRAVVALATIATRLLNRADLASAASA